MNTFPLVAVSTLVIVILAGLVALVRAAKNAPDGYEDEFGFHAGRQPARVAGSVALSIDSYDHGAEVPTEEVDHSVGPGSIHGHGSGQPA
jgi:hypothetical protein